MTTGYYQINDEGLLEKLWFLNYVYILQDVESVERPFKIGQTRNFTNRKQQLQTAHPHKLRSVALLPDPLNKLEARLHSQFSASRLHGEWFSETVENNYSRLLFLQQIAQELGPFIFMHAGEGRLVLNQHLVEPYYSLFESLPSYPGMSPNGPLAPYPKEHMDYYNELRQIRHKYEDPTMFALRASRKRCILR